MGFKHGRVLIKCIFHDGQGQGFCWLTVVFTLHIRREMNGEVWLSFTARAAPCAMDAN